VIGDPASEEPDDPYPDYGDPEEMFDLEIPDAEGVSKELFRAFWGLVGVFNVGLLTLSLGALLVVFREQWFVGGALVAVGVVSLAYGVHRYRVYRERDPFPD